MKLVFAGTPAVAVPALEALLDSRHEVLAVLTRPDAPTGRGRSLNPSPVAEVALEHGLELLRPATPRDPDFLARLETLAPDCAPVVAYGGLLPARVLEIPRLGWVNLHFSLLPAWRGAAPVQHAIWHGDEFTGASVFQIEQSLDSGPVFGTLIEGIDATDTAGDVLNRLAVSGAELLVSCLDGIADGVLTPVPQPADGVSLAPKLTTDDARVSWSKPAFAVDRRVRACTPAPGAWTTFRGDRLKLGPVSQVTDVTDLEAGQIRAERRRVLVGTATHAVVLSTVQPRGRKVVAAPDWARGLRPPLPGDDHDTEFLE